MKIGDVTSAKKQTKEEVLLEVELVLLAATGAGLLEHIKNAEVNSRSTIDTANDDAEKARQTQKKAEAVWNRERDKAEAAWNAIMNKANKVYRPVLRKSEEEIERTDELVNVANEVLKAALQLK